MSLQSLPGSDLNQIGDKVKIWLKDNQLKQGEIATYRLLTGVKNLDITKHNGEMLYNSVVGIPLRGKILDPDKGPVEIGKVKSLDPITKIPSFQKFYVYPKRGDGNFYLRSDSVADLDVYDYIQLSNENSSNPYRDKSAPITFERVNEGKESKNRIAKRNYLRDSLNAIESWNYEELSVAAAGFNINASPDMDVLRDKLQTEAEKNPERFYKTIDSEDNKIKALIKLATEAEIIAFNAHENKWFYAGGSNETLALLDRREGIDPPTQLVEFLKNSANGPRVKSQLEKLLSAKRKQNS